MKKLRNVLDLKLYKYNEEGIKYKFSYEEIEECVEFMIDVWKRVPCDEEISAFVLDRILKDKILSNKDHDLSDTQVDLILNRLEEGYIIRNENVRREKIKSHMNAKKLNTNFSKEEFDNLIEKIKKYGLKLVKDIPVTLEFTDREKRFIEELERESDERRYNISLEKFEIEIMKNRDKVMKEIYEKYLSSDWKIQKLYLNEITAGIYEHVNQYGKEFVIEYMGKINEINKLIDIDTTIWDEYILKYMG